MSNADTARHHSAAFQAEPVPWLRQPEQRAVLIIPEMSSFRLNVVEFRSPVGMNVAEYTVSVQYSSIILVNNTIKLIRSDQV